MLKKNSATQQSECTRNNCYLFIHKKHLQKVLDCMFSFYNELPLSIHSCAENATKCVAMHHLFVPLCSTYISYRTSKLDRLVAMWHTSNNLCNSNNKWDKHASMTSWLIILSQGVLTAMRLCVEVNIWLCINLCRCSQLKFLEVPICNNYSEWSALALVQSMYEQCFSWCLYCVKL